MYLSVCDRYIYNCKTHCDDGMGKWKITHDIRYRRTALDLISSRLDFLLSHPFSDAAMVMLSGLLLLMPVVCECLLPFNLHMMRLEHVQCEDFAGANCYFSLYCHRSYWIDKDKTRSIHKKRDRKGEREGGEERRGGGYTMDRNGIDEAPFHTYNIRQNEHTKTKSRQLAKSENKWNMIRIRFFVDFWHNLSILNGRTSSITFGGCHYLWFPTNAPLSPYNVTVESDQIIWCYRFLHFFFSLSPQLSLSLYLPLPFVGTLPHILTPSVLTARFISHTQSLHMSYTSDPWTKICMTIFSYREAQDWKCSFYVRTDKYPNMRSLSTR